MNWEARIRRFGAPGPLIADRFSDTHHRREQAIERAHDIEPSPADAVDPPRAGAIIVGVEGSDQQAERVPAGSAARDGD